MSLSSSISFIIDEATDEDLERIDDATHQRRKALGAKRAASLTVGAAVETKGLSPKYMNGLKGAVQRINGKSLDLMVTDKRSLMQITGTKYGPAFGVLDSDSSYVVRGIPTTCVVDTDG